MKPKFLLGLAPLLAVAAFAVAPAAVQAEVCFSNTEGGACIEAAWGLAATSTTNSVFVDPAGFSVTCASASLEGKAETKGKSKITKSTFGGCTVNVTGCTPTIEQASNWNDQLDGSAAAGFKDTITIPTGGQVWKYAGSSCTLPKEIPMSRAITGNWINGNPSTLSFSKRRV